MRFCLYILLSAFYLVSPAFGQEPAPKKTDSMFVTDSEADELDVSKPAGSRISFKIKIDRVVGKTDNDGKLVDPVNLIAEGVVSPFVTLKVSGFDIDSDFTDSPECTPRESDRIKVNGQNIGANGAEAFLNGTSDRWKTNTFKVPIHLIRFGKWICDQGNCSWQGDGENLIEIEVSIAAPQSFDCGNKTINWKAKVDWGAIDVKALYPVVMIHGYKSGGEFWTNQNFVLPFQQKGMLYDNSISMSNNSVSEHGRQLKSLIQDITAQKFHVKHIHVVAHSQGGVDSREFLAKTLPPNLGVLSLITLSSPHRGTILADYQIAFTSGGVSSLYSDSLWRAMFAQIGSSLGPPVDEGTRSLTVVNMRSYNAANGALLPSDTTVDGEKNTVSYYSIGADADIDNSGDAGLLTLPISTGNPDETVGMRNFDKPSEYAPRLLIANAFYATLGVVAEISIEPITVSGPGGGTITTNKVKETFYVFFQNNDFVVTSESARYQSPFAYLSTVDANHATVGSFVIANMVITTIRSVQPVS